MASTGRKRNVLYAATDGTWSMKQQVGAWAYVVEGGFTVAGVETGPKVTHNRMELRALLELLIAYPDVDIHVYCDSMAVVRGFSEKLELWARRKFKHPRRKDGKKIAHCDLWKRVASAARNRTITIEHVRSHDGHELNELADEAAGITRREYERSIRDVQKGSEGTEQGVS